MVLEPGQYRNQHGHNARFRGWKTTFSSYQKNNIYGWWELYEEARDALQNIGAEIDWLDEGKITVDGKSREEWESFTASLGGAY